MVFRVRNSTALSAIRTDPPNAGCVSFRAGAFVAPRLELDGAVRDDDVERRPDGALGELDLAPMGAHQFGRDREAQPGAAGARRALEGLEQMLARLGGEAGAGVGDVDDHHRAFAPAGDADLVARRVVGLARLQRLHGVAGEVDQHAQQLIVVGVDHQAAFDRADPADPPVGLQVEGLAHLLDQCREPDHLPVGSRFLCAPIGQRRLAEIDRALERAHQLGREALHARVGQMRQAVGNELGRSQQVAQIMVDLRHRQSERREPVLLLQHRGDVLLHGAELALGDADLVLPARQRDDARGVFRVGAERDHIDGDAMHRPHEHVMQREIEEHRRDRGDDQRYHQDVARIAPHRLAQGSFVDHDLEEIAAHRGRTDDPHDVAVLAEQQRLEGFDDRRHHRQIAHVDVLADLLSDVAGGEHPALLVDPHRHHVGADAFEQLLRQALHHHVFRRFLEHDRRRMGGGQAVVEPSDPEAGDRGDVEDYLRQHDGHDGEAEQLAGQPQPRAPARGGSGALVRVLALGGLAKHESIQPLISQPRRRNQTMMRLSSGLVKRPVK
jgi:hypothetical protein